MSTSTKMNSKRRSDEDQASRGGDISHASSLSKRQKINKASRESDVIGEEHDVLSSILPLRLTALGRYLPLKDTGRFLLRVSKDMTTSIFGDRVSLDEAVEAAKDRTGEDKDAIGDDGRVITSDGSEATDTEAKTISLRQGKARNEAWKYLCEQKWRNPSTLEHLVSVLGETGDASAGEMTMDWERLFRKSLPCPPKSAVRAPVEDYSFIFSLKKCDESERSSAVPLATYVLKGDEAVKFLKTGKSASLLKLDSPIMLGNFASKEACRENFWGHQSQNMISTLHGLRKSDGKMCELNYQTNLCFLFNATYDGERYDFYRWTNGDVLNVGDLKKIVSFRDVDGVDLHIGLSIERQFSIAAPEKDDGSTDYQITHIGFTTKIYFPSRTVESGGYDFNQLSNELATGVTVADFLSRLDVEWK